MPCHPSMIGVKLGSRGWVTAWQVPWYQCSRLSCSGVLRVQRLQSFKTRKWNGDCDVSFKWIQLERCLEKTLRFRGWCMNMLTCLCRTMIFDHTLSFLQYEDPAACEATLRGTCGIEWTLWVFLFPWQSWHRFVQKNSETLMSFSIRQLHQIFGVSVRGLWGVRWIWSVVDVDSQQVGWWTTMQTLQTYVLLGSIPGVSWRWCHVVNSCRLNRQERLRIEGIWRASGSVVWLPVTCFKLATRVCESSEIAENSWMFRRYTGY